MGSKENSVGVLVALAIAFGGVHAQTVAPAAMKRSPEQMMAYGQKIAAAIRAHIVHPDPLEGNPVAVIHVRTDAQGLITQAELVEASGVKSWDEAVLRAVERISAVPLDTDGSAPPRLELVFRAR